MEQLEGDLIATLSRRPTSVPLIYPKQVMIFDWMDSSAKRFHSLKELLSDPSLPNFASGVSRPSKRLDVRDPGSLGVAERVKNLFDPSTLLIPAKSEPLPSDEALRAFLNEGRRVREDTPDEKAIIQSLLTDEYEKNPVASLLNESPEIKKVLQSQAFNHSKPGLFSSAETALRSQAVLDPRDVTQEDARSTTAHRLAQESSLRPSTGPGVLKLRARKPGRDGSLQPAQASEIYLTTRDLRELLKDFEMGSAVLGEVKSVAELWAKAEKNVSRNPEVALGVKSILLQAKVGRARTDPYGQASLENLSPDDQYFLIGIDKDVQTDVVTIWSKEVEVAPGENTVELTSTDVIYQE